MSIIIPWPTYHSKISLFTVKLHDVLCATLLWPVLPDLITGLRDTSKQSRLKETISTAFLKDHFFTFFSHFLTLHLEKTLLEEAGILITVQAKIRYFTLTAEIAKWWLITLKCLWLHSPPLRILWHHCCEWKCINPNKMCEKVHPSCLRWHVFCSYTDRKRATVPYSSDQSALPECYKCYQFSPKRRCSRYFQSLFFFRLFLANKT